MPRLGTQIRQRRHQLGWKQVYLAAKVGVHQSAISRIERGERANIGIETVERIALALGVPLADLLANASSDERPTPATVQ